MAQQQQQQQSNQQITVGMGTALTAQGPRTSRPEGWLQLPSARRQEDAGGLAGWRAAVVDDIGGSQQAQRTQRQIERVSCPVSQHAE